MKAYIHARLTAEDRATLDDLREMTGLSESEIVRRSLQEMRAAMRQHTALDLAGDSAGKFKEGPRDLSTNRRHMDEFGT